MHRKIWCTAIKQGPLFFPAIALAVVFFLPPSAPAKMAGAQAMVYQAAPNRFSSLFVRDFESRMRLFFESKLKGPRVLLMLSRDQLPRETDFFLLAKLWNSLSPGFKTLYKMATQIPDTFNVYLSPGGHFAVYYLPLTSDSTNGVAATDTIGYGVAGDWRPRLPVPNGIPDYVDEVAWALDSAYAMEVTGFNFIPPLPHKDSVHTSNRYPVVITWMSPGWYGQTYPDPSAIGPKGFPSYLELRNNWNGDEWKPMGYDLHPGNAIRVTCAHEHFHGIQYAMAWNTNMLIDDFPLTWIEGTAVCMEDLAFDYVNDYLQYTPYFFNNPVMSFFTISYDITVYTDALLVMYLFQKATGTPRIDFIRTIFFNDYAQLTPWDQNLRATALSFGQPWPVFLNRFHTASYYSGARANTSLFLADAGLMGKWGYAHDTLSGSYSITKSVTPYGMQIFSFGPDSSAEDTIPFKLLCGAAGQSTIPYPSWAASCIVRGKARPDTTLPLSIDTAGLAQWRIADWKSQNEILIILSNGHPSQTRNATIALLPCPVTYHNGDKKEFHIASADHHSSMAVELTAKNDLRCALNTSIVSASLPALPSSKLAISPYFAVGFPAAWGENDAAISLIISLSSFYLDSMRNEKPMRNDSVQVFRWNALPGSWEQEPFIPIVSRDSISWRTDSAASGIYALVACKYVAPDSSSRIVVFPNPGYSRAKKFIRFEGNGIQEIRIYSVDGTIVANSTKEGAFQPYSGGLLWRLVNNHGKNVVPGCYTAVVTRITAPAGEKRSSLHKVLVFP